MVIEVRKHILKILEEGHVKNMKIPGGHGRSERGMERP